MGPPQMQNDGLLPVVPGEVVRLFGLKAQGATELNGSMGVVIGQRAREAAGDNSPGSASVEADARWMVRVMGSGRNVAVRRTNLTTARAGPAFLHHFLMAGVVFSVTMASLAHAAGPSTLTCGAAPLCSLLWYVLTVSWCYWLHSPLLADGVFAPAISEMAVSRPARLVYRVGFGLCGLLLAVTMLEVFVLTEKHHAFIKGNETEQGSSNAEVPLGIGWGLLAAGGVALQGVCTLRVEGGAETVLHLGGAMLAMMGAMQHGAASNAWFSALPEDSPLLRQGRGAWGLWLRRDAMQQATASGGGLLLLLFAIPLVMQAASRMGKSSGGSAMVNGMGLMQWAIVAGIALFFSTYTLDLMALD